MNASCVDLLETMLLLRNLARDSSKEEFVLVN